MKTIFAIITLVILSLPASAAPSSVLEQAARGIETHRKGDAMIRFARKDGVPVSGLRVEVTLSR